MKKRILYALGGFCCGFAGDLAQQLVMGIREKPSLLWCTVSGIVFAIITFCLCRKDDREK